MLKERLGKQEIKKTQNQENKETENQVAVEKALEIESKKVEE